MTYFYVTGFQMLAVFAIVFFLQKKFSDKLDNKRRKGLIGCYFAGGISGVVSSILAFSTVGIFSFLQEIIFFILIAAAVALVYFKSNIKPPKFKLLTEKSDKIIFSIGLIFGLAMLAVMAIGNSKYIFPSDEFGHISDFYFNADVDRAIYASAGSAVSSAAAPLYRLALMPVYLVIIGIELVLGKVGLDNYTTTIITGYLLCIVQVIVNAFAAVLVKKLLGSFSKATSILAAVFYIVGFGSLWISILPETYAGAVMFLLLSLYLYQEKKNAWILTAVFAVGINPLTFAALIPQIFKTICNKLKENTFSTRNKAFIALGAVFTLGCIAFAGIVLSPYIFKWSDLGSLNIQKLNYAIPQVITSWFVGPSIVSIESYIVQMPVASISILAVGAVFFSMAVGGFIRGRKNMLAKSAFAMLLGGILLHIILGFGRSNGIIYAPLYSWAGCVLIACLFKNENSKNKLYNCGFGISAAVVLAVNICWIFTLGGFVSNIEFCDGEKQYMDNAVYMDSPSGKIQFRMANGNLVRYLDSYIIAEDMQSWRVHENYIAGVSNTNNWVYLHQDEGSDEIILNNGVRNKEMFVSTRFNADFYIFGLGDRPKFLFTSGEIGFDLINCQTGEVMLTNLKKIAIDSKGRKINTVSYYGLPIKVYENKDGIYIDYGGEIIPIYEGGSVVFPTFPMNEYNVELHNLFNEVLVNVTDEGLTSNLLAYDEIYYKDAAMMAMVLEKTGNTHLITQWIDSLTQVYDMKNGEKDSANLGQLLYLISLSDNPNEELIDEILQQAHSLKDSSGALTGLTDGENHPAYQTRWLKFGMQVLGIDSSEFVVPEDANDEYAQMMWFDGLGTLGCPSVRTESDPNQPHSYYAQKHFYGDEVELPGAMRYPLSFAYDDATADYEGAAVIRESMANSRLVEPHGLTAAEMFLYLLDGGKIEN